MTSGLRAALGQSWSGAEAPGPTFASGRDLAGYGAGGMRTSRDGSRPRMQWSAWSDPPILPTRRLLAFLCSTGAVGSRARLPLDHRCSNRAPPQLVRGSSGARISLDRFTKPGDVRSVVVAAPSDSAPHAAEHHEDQADHQKDDPDGPQDRDLRDKSDDEEYYA